MKLAFNQLAEGTKTFLRIANLKVNAFKYAKYQKCWEADVLLTPDQCRQIVKSGILDDNRERHGSALKALRDAIQNDFVATFDPLLLTDEGQLMNGGHRIVLRSEMTTNEPVAFRVAIETSVKMILAIDAGRRRNARDQYAFGYGITISNVEASLAKARCFIFKGILDSQTAQTAHDLEDWFRVLETEDLTNTSTLFNLTWVNFSKAHSMGKRYYGIIDVFYKIWVIFGEKVGTQVLESFFKAENNNPYANIFDMLYGCNGVYSCVGTKRTGDTWRRSWLINRLMEIDPKYEILFSALSEI